MVGGKISAPQYLRGLAAFMVMLAHWNALGAFPEEHSQLLFIDLPRAATPPNIITPLLGWWDWSVQYIWPLTFSFATGGVLIFFLISGFVISISVEKYSTADFAVRRCARLFLPVWAALLLWFIVHAMTVYIGIGTMQPYSFYDFLLNGFLVNDWFWRPNIEPGLWTLLIEVKFYILLAPWVGQNPPGMVT